MSKAPLKTLQPASGNEEALTAAPISRRSFIKGSTVLGVSSILAGSPLGWLPKPAFAEPGVDIAAVKSADAYRSTIKAVEILGGMGKFVSKQSRVGLLINSPWRHPGSYVSPEITLAAIRIIVLHAILLMNHTSVFGGENNLLSGKKNISGMNAHITMNDSVRHMVNHPAFTGFGEYLLPWESNDGYDDTPMKKVGSLLPYHNHVNPQVVVASINQMIDEVNDGRTIFYEFYTKREKKEDITKASTGLFFFRGKPGAPFAVVCSGGGFAYVGSLHEGFPYALELSKKEYNAFVLKYRVGSEQKATEDLAAAVAYIFKNAKKLNVSPENYSLWGSSAGARMVGNIALTETAGFGGRDLPKPCIVVIVYTGHTIFSKNFPPTFIMVSEDDGIVHKPTVDRRVKNLRNAGIEVAYHEYKHAGHGFGLGVGTDAEGWMANAIEFWEKHLLK